MSETGFLLLTTLLRRITHGWSRQPGAEGRQCRYAIGQCARRVFLWEPRRFLLLLFGMACVTGALAQTLQHANIIYDMPDDWIRGRLTAEGVQMLLPASRNDRCDTCRIFIATGDARTQAPAAFLESQFSNLFDDDKRDRLQVVDVPGKRRTVAGHAARMPSWRIGKRIYIGVLFELENRYEFVAFGLRYKSPKDVAKVDAVFTPMAERLRFLSEGAASLLPDARPGELEGLFRGYKLRTAVGVGGAGTIAPSYKTLVFWKDGYFYEGTPPAGLRAAQMGPLRYSGDRNVGVYFHEGSAVTLTYADGRIARMTPRDDGAGWQFLGRDLTPVTPLRDGERVQGRLSGRVYGGVSGSGGAAAGQSEIRLKKDGSFESSAVVSASGGGLSGHRRSAVSGTYRIRDGLITFLATNGDAPPARLIFRDGDQIIAGTTPLR